MFNSVRRVDEVEVVNNDEFLSRIDPEVIYADKSSLGLFGRFLKFSNMGEYYFFFIIFLCILTTFVLSIGIGFIYQESISTILMGISICCFSVVSFYFLLFRGMDLAAGSIHSRYYVIGDDRVAEIPENGGEIENCINIDEIKSISFDSGSFEVEGSDNSIEFSLPSEGEVSEIQDALYNIS